jgi:PmbA protein
VTVYLGQRRGNASTSDFSRAALESTVQAAYDIARFTAEDPAAGLPDAADIATEQRELDLFHPWAVGSEQAAAWPWPARRGLCGGPPHHQQRRRGRVGRSKAILRRAHARLSRRLRQLAPQPVGGAHRRQGRRHAARLLVQLDARRARVGRPEAVGRYAAERALSRLKSRRLSTRMPGAVRVAAGRRPAGPFRAGHQRRRAVPRTSFLLDSLGKPVFPEHIDVVEDPFVRAARAVAVRRRGRARAGAPGGRRRRVQGYFLSSYSARKLGMKTTGNAGGSHNLTLRSRRTRAGDDLDAMLRKLGTACSSPS